MQGVFVGNSRPKSKKAVKEAIAAAPETVYVENTSMFANGDFSGMLNDMPVGSQVGFVGPDPFTKRNFYGTIKRKAAGFTVT